MDRQYVIDIILRAKAETARAFAEATGEMEAFDKLLDEQKGKTKAASEAQKEYAGELDRGDAAMTRYKRSIADAGAQYDKSNQSHKKVLTTQIQLEQAVRKLVRAQNDSSTTAAQEAKAQESARQAQVRLGTALKNNLDLRRNDAQDRAEQIRNEIEYQSRLELTGKELDKQATAEARLVEQRRRANEQRIRQEEQILRSATRPADTLAKTNINQTQEIRATRELAAARDRLVQSGVRVEDADKRIHEVRQRALRDYGFQNQAARDAARVSHDEVEAYRLVEDSLKKVESARRASRGSRSVHGVDPRTELLASTNVGQSSSGGGGGFGTALAAVKNQMADLDTTTSGFSGHLKNAFGFAAVALIQPLAVLILGLVGTMGALASAAIAAGTAIGVTFISGIAQGIPVIGLFAAAMQRLQSVFGYVSTVMGQAQQRFQAQFQVAQQNRMGINQVAIAVHQYSDALFAAQQAVRNVDVAEHSYQNALYAQRIAVYQVQVAQLGLSVARRDAARQLQQLIFEETNAKLAAEASSLAITNSQKALQQAIATGGDVQQAQLQLAQAHASHTQSVASAQQAIQDAAPGSIARQQIQATVAQGQQGVDQAKHAVVDANFALQQAQVGIIQAQRAVVDAKFQVAEARAAIVQAQQAAAGYNVGIASQLAWLRATMSKTELALANNIKNILGLFQSLPGHVAKFRAITDAIVQPFVAATGRIYKLLTDPKIFGALLTLAHQMGAAMNMVVNTVFSNQSVQNFLKILTSTAQNMKPFGEIISNIFRGLQAVVVASLPFVHQFAGFISNITNQFANWATSVKGQNWLKNFFDIAFKSLEAFINLGLSVAKLFAAIIGPGGGAQAGIKIIQGWTTWIDNATKSINRHGGAWRGLQSLWQSIQPTLHFLGQIIGAIVKGLLQLGGTSQGRDALKGLGDVLSKVVIPGFVQGFIFVGRFFGKLMDFFHHHPDMEKLAKDLIGIAVGTSVLSKAFGLIFGPMAAVIGGISKLPALVTGLKGAFEGLNIAEFFGNPVVLAITAVAAAIVGIVVATHNLGDLIKQVESPFKLLWKDIKPEIEDLGKSFTNFLNTILKPFGIHFKNTFQAMHGVVKTFIDVFGFLLRGIVTAISLPLRLMLRAWQLVFTQIGNAFKTVVGVFKGVFEVIKGVVTLNGHLIVKGFVNIGKSIASGIWGAIKGIANFFVNIFKDAIHALLNFLGISSPSKKFENIGHELLNGLWNGLKGIIHFGAKIIGWIGDGIGDVLQWFEKLGEKIYHAIEKGVKKLIGGLIDIIPSPIRNLLGIGPGSGGLSTPPGEATKPGVRNIEHSIAGRFSTSNKDDEVRRLVATGLSRAQAHRQVYGYRHGGAIPGFGGGDIVDVSLEPGEHVFTKDEVSSAGGHGAIYALRRSLGGGGQGGPARYAQGGQISGQSSDKTTRSIFDLGLHSQQGQTTQGVTGLFGSLLANFIVFTSQAHNDWLTFWSKFNKDTQSNFKDHEKIWTDSFDFLSKTINDFWGKTNDQVHKSLNTLKNNFKSVYKVFDTDTFNAFWYVQHAANASLKAFQAPPVKVDLGAPPKFAGGGIVGQIGERGRDAVHALLGKGEAVLNYAHQKVVEPAMRAYYGFGLPEMFNKVRGEHAGGGNGYAKGGYVWPFGGPVTWERSDQGVDFSMAPGTKIGPIGKSKVIGIIPDWYQGQPYIWWQLLDGPDKGKYAFVSEQITNLAHPGQILNANDAVAEFAASGTGIEYGFATASGNTLAKATTGYTEGEVTPAGTAMRQLLEALASGDHIPILGIGGKGAGAVEWKEIKAQAVKGRGVLADTLRRALKKVRDAANKYGEKKAGQSGGGGGALAGGVAGPVVTASWFDDPTTASGHVHVPGFAELSNPPGSDNFSALGHLPMGELIEVGYGGRHINIPKIDVGAGGSGLGGHIRAIDLSREAADMLPGFINSGLANVSWRDLHKKAFAKGGFAEGSPVGIVGHIGEWVLNRQQQRKLASWLGTSINGLRNSLGLKMGGGAFRDGGEITGYATGKPSDKDKIPPLPEIYRALAGSRVGQIYNPSAHPYLPTVTSKTGVVDISDINLGTPGFDIQAINQYNAAQAIVIQKIEKNKKGFTKGLDTFLANFNKVGGDNGLFALATQAIQDFVNQQSTIVQLAAAGFRVVNNVIRKLKGGPQTAVAAARSDLAETNAEIDRLSQLQREEVIALRAINAELKRLPRTVGNMPKIQQLLAARKQMTDNLNSIDQSLAQGYADRYQKTITQFQAQTDQLLRGTTTLTGRQFAAVGIFARGGGSGTIRSSLNNIPKLLNKVGAQTASALAQMAQSIAQTFGDPNQIIRADSEVLRTARDTQKDLQKRYAAAAAKAKSDPRWRSVADDLLQQLTSATTSIAQAMAQRLSDEITKQDTKTQIGQAGFQLRDTISQALAQMSNVVGPGNQFAAQAQQITTSQQRTSFLRQQLSSYGQLYQQAQGQGNVGAMNTLRQTMMDLVGQIAQATLATQQLITANRQLAVTILTNTTQAAAGFRSSTQSIAQALGSLQPGQNLGSLIQYGISSIQQLQGEHDQVAQGVSNAMNDRNTPFGANQRQANGLLSQLLGAFNQGPQQYADALQNMTPQLSSFEAGLPPDQQTLFQNLVQSLTDNTTALSAATIATQQLVTQSHQLAVSILQGQTQASSGFFSAAQTITQTLGAISGSLNLPQLIQQAQEAGTTIRQQGQQTVGNINDTINDPNSPFGTNQIGASGLLSALVGAFNQGPQAFATTLAGLSPTLSGFEAGLPPDQQALFQSLVQSLIDNTTAQVDNTQQLQQLNATTNQQQFTSSAWTMFRNAIFNGLGGLLPQYAMTVPAMDTGGLLASSGILYGHKDEMIVPASIASHDLPGGRHIESHLHLTSPTEVADPVYLSNKMAWNLNHDPNNR